MSDVCKIRGDHGRAVQRLLARVGDKWALPVLAALHDDGPVRFTEVQQRLPGISQRMLTLTLRKLERDGLVVRTAHAEMPPRVEYRTSPLAADLLPHAIGLAAWAHENNPALDAHREAYDARTTRRS